MPAHEKNVEMLVKLAKEKGVKSAKLISTKDIVVGNYVAQKCKFGCPYFAKRFTCPPYSPTPSETREVLKSYNHALLFEFIRLVSDKKRPKIHEVMFELERNAFLNGFHMAFAYAAGPCRICPRCPAEEVKDRNEFSKKECINPLMARPSMEASSIDVYKTARKAGFEINPVKERGQDYKSFGLLLLE